MQLAEVRTGHDAIGFAIKWIAGGDREVDDLAQLAGRGVVVERLLNNVGVEMLNLLE